MSLIESKVKQCIMDIIQSYNGRKRMEKFVNSINISETDGTFSQVVIRTLVNDIWFTEPSHVPLFGRFGNAIAQKEEEIFIQKILEETQGYEEIDLNDFTFELVIKKLLSIFSGELRRILLLVPIKIKYDYMLKKGDMWPIEYDYELKSFILKLGTVKIPVYSVHEDLINSHVICVNKDFGQWFYKKHTNPYDPAKEETIYVGIKRAEEPCKVEILARSLIKFQIYDQDRVKVLKIAWN